MYALWLSEKHRAIVGCMSNTETLDESVCVLSCHKACVQCKHSIVGTQIVAQLAQVQQQYGLLVMDYSVLYPRSKASAYAVHGMHDL